MPEDAPRSSLLEVIAQPGPAAALALVGELDPGTAPILQARLLELADDPAVTSVAVDLARITFLDSSGVRAIVTGSEALRARGAPLTLTAPNPNVRRVLEVTGLAQLVTVD